MIKKGVTCLLLFITLFLVACSGQGVLLRQDLENWFGAPEKIEIHYEGEKYTISKDDEAYSQIMSLLNKKILSTYKPSTADCDYDICELESVKQNGLAVELVYSKEMNADIVCGTDLIKRRYNRLLMPLTGDLSNLIFFGNPDIGGNALGDFENNDALIDYINQFTQG
ncbi:hypothetical protein [Dethiobacter alkaliphilus]|uniref:Lipoprotein n=1 Tax=Dethiobacter alkaliphilus AHT 1 TaxID=555088 RepID=C0GD73_DETAL|nr:hypothetical protein [Dethiobacter alkaliphilus]EEG78594.1 hypothetical protein DealDRAFT_0524 [Dethiobacter alkaliphilus AHT 1]